MVIQQDMALSGKHGKATDILYHLLKWSYAATTLKVYKLSYLSWLNWAITFLLMLNSKIKVKL